MKTSKTETMQYELSFNLIRKGELSSESTIEYSVIKLEDNLEDEENPIKVYIQSDTITFKANQILKTVVTPIIFAPNQEHSGLFAIEIKNPTNAIVDDENMIITFKIKPEVTNE